MEKNLPAGWNEISLETVTDILDSQRIPINAEEREKRIAKAKELFPYYGATGQVGFIDDYIFEGESVLLGEDAAPFLEFGKDKAYLVNGKFWVNNHAHILRAKDGIENKFLCYQLNTINYQPFVSGTTRLKLTQASLKNIPIRVAPLNEQRRIVSKIEELFSRLDEGEAALKRVQRLLTSYRQAVLKAAVTGELTKEWREANQHNLESGADLLQRILKERREQWQGRGQYSEPFSPDARYLPDLPETWSVATIDQLALRVEYGTSAKCDRDTEGIPVLRMGNIFEGRLILDELKYLAADHSEFPQLLLEQGDMLFNRTNSAELVGKTAIYKGNPPKCSYASYLIRVRFIETESEYISTFINSLYGRDWVKRVVSQQVGQANVNGTKLKSLTVPLPPYEEQQEIVQQLDTLFSQIQTLESWCSTELTRSATLRQSILKDAFSGQLVPQDPSDEPASELLARIQAERQQSPAKPARRAKPAAQQERS